MKAIIENGKTHKVIEERGQFIYAEDSKGKVKCFLVSKVEIVEISEMPKEKKYKRMISKTENTFERDFGKGILQAHYLDCQIESGNFKPINF